MLQEDLSVWSERPASSDVLLAAIRDVKHLLPLYSALTSKLLLDVMKGSELYLSVVRSLPNSEAAEV